MPGGQTKFSTAWLSSVDSDGQNSVTGVGKERMTIMAIVIFVTLILDVIMLVKHSYFSIAVKRNIKKQSSTARTIYRQNSFSKLLKQDPVLAKHQLKLFIMVKAALKQKYTG